MIKNDANAPAAATFYKDLLSEIKSRVRKAQNRVATVANIELLALYWDIGGLLVDRQKMEGWGAGVLRRLATDLKNELSDQQGYSERNLKLMTQFYREYPGLFAIGQQAVAQSPDSRYYSEEENGLPFLQGCAEFEARFPKHKIHCSQTKKLAHVKVKGDI